MRRSLLLLLLPLIAAAALVSTASGRPVANAVMTGANVFVAPAAQGTGDCSSEANACALTAALVAFGAAGPVDGETIRLASGTYALAAQDYQLGGLNGETDGENLTLEPDADATSRPVVLTDGGEINLDADGDIIEGVDISANASADASTATPLSLNDGSIARNLRITAAGQEAVEMATATLRDSLVVASGDYGVWNNSTGGSATLTLINDTIVNTANTGVGIELEPQSGDGPPTTVTAALTNVITEGGSSGTGLRFNPVGGNVDASATATNSYISNSPDIDLTDPITTAPSFRGVGDYREVTGSSSIDTGTANPPAATTGETDVDGNARTIGSAPDVGAYEYVPATPAPALGTPSITRSQDGTSATITLPITTQGAALTLSTQYGQTTSYGSSLPQSVSYSATSATVTLAGLNPADTYHAMVTAAGDGGSAGTGDLNISGAITAPPAPVVTPQPPPTPPTKSTPTKSTPTTTPLKAKVLPKKPVLGSAPVVDCTLLYTKTIKAGARTGDTNQIHCADKTGVASCSIVLAMGSCQNTSHDLQCLPVGKLGDRNVNGPFADAPGGFSCTGSRETSSFFCATRLDSRGVATVLPIYTYTCSGQPLTALRCTRLTTSTSRRGDGAMGADSSTRSQAVCRFDTGHALTSTDAPLSGGLTYVPSAGAPGAASGDGGVTVARDADNALTLSNTGELSVPLQCRSPGTVCTGNLLVISADGFGAVRYKGVGDFSQDILAGKLALAALKAESGGSVAGRKPVLFYVLPLPANGTTVKAAAVHYDALGRQGVTDSYLLANGFTSYAVRPAGTGGGNVAKIPGSWNRISNVGDDTSLTGP